MKQMSTVTTVIIAAAVLVAAYAIGLLVREIRMGHAPTGEDVAVLEHGVDPHRPGTGEPRSVKAPNPSETREERAKALKKMSNLTEEEKQRFRDQVRESVSPSGEERNRSPMMKQREEMMQKLQTMSPEERKAFEAGMQRRLEEAPAQPLAQAGG